jgi:hypothetical protein
MEKWAMTDADIAKVADALARLADNPDAQVSFLLDELVKTQADRDKWRRIAANYAYQEAKHE